MKRVWFRIIISLGAAFLIVNILYAMSLLFPPPFSNVAERIIDLPPDQTYTWIPHERGMGPQLFGPALPIGVVAAIFFYVAFTLWSRRRSRAARKT